MLLHNTEGYVLSKKIIVKNKVDTGFESGGW